MGLNKIIILLSLVLLISACTPKEVSLSELSSEFKELDREAEKSSLQLEEFERLKDIDFSKVSVDDIKTIISGDKSYYRKAFAEGNEIYTKQEGEVLIIKFPEEIAASKHLIIMQSTLEDSGYQFVERLDYEEISTYFKKENQNLYLLKKNEYIIMLKK